MGDLSSAVCETQATPPAKTVRLTHSFVQNVIASLLRVLAVSLVALILPAFLIQHLSVQTYAAWVLIVQLAAYTSYLDLGIQTSVAKFVAEYSARGDLKTAGRYASAGLGLMIAAGFLGVSFTMILAWYVPQLFASMPLELHRQVRISLMLVGGSLSFGLICAVYAAVFLGLQRYWIPTWITVLNRLSFVAVVIAIVTLRGNLAAMGLGVAIVNVATGCLQIGAWKRQASHISISLNLLNSATIKRVGRFCSMQSIWTVAMLCISGLDVAIVGHYDYVQTAYYGIATMPANFLLILVGAVLSPLMPASSALSTHRSPKEMGHLLTRFTHYNTILLLLTGLPLMVYGKDILRIWVGPDYAVHTVTYLRILVFANVIRNLCAPYATMITAVGKQETAIVAAVSEAIVNLGSSIYLASRFGAIGVALGTVVGSFVSVLLHFTITMALTRSEFAISRSRLLLRALLRPAILVLPSILIVPVLSRWVDLVLRITWLMIWGTATLALAWFVTLRSDQRRELVSYGKAFAVDIAENHVVRNFRAS
jgi:O-antigen/teichoic acid export membrane protein